MPSPRDFILGPWRAVPVLGVTQILAWGAVPLALFCPVGYGRIIGRTASPALIGTSVAPLVIAFVALSFTCFMLIKRSV